MPTVTVVADTTHSMPAEQLEREGIKQVSLYVTHGGRTEREAEMNLDAFYDRLRAGGDLPKTAAPSIGDFLAVYEPLLDAGQDIVSVHISGALSGTIDIARQAAEDALRTRPERRIEIVDSRSVAGGLALMILAAAAGARAGEDAPTVAARAEQAVQDTKIWFAVDTLEYLRKGGRIGTAQAWVGGALKIKPILSLESEILPVERVRTSGRAFERMVKYAQELHEGGADAWCVQHIQTPGEAARLVEQARAIFGCKPLFIGEVGPVIGVHAGPGMLGIGAMPRSMLA